MPVLMNARHESFAQHLYEGLTGDDAYKKAGFKANRGNAARLRANERIMSRVAELQTGSAARADITVDSLSKMLLATRARAVKAGDLTNERQCAMDLAKLHGLIVDRSKFENENVAWIVSDKPMSNEEWVREFCGGKSSEAVN